jgi:hypothetical protein
MSTPTSTPGPDPPRERVVLTLEALPSDRPFAVRLRLILKDLLRREQMRCVRIDRPMGGATPDAGEERQP